MTNGICKRCGCDLRKGASFCASCGEATPLAEIANLYAPEPAFSCRKQTEQTVPSHSAVTEKIPATLTARMSPSDDNEFG
jgi:hypothetical protein